jgi:hypothetical protein
MFKKEKIVTLRVLALLIALFSIITSVSGIAFPDMYKPFTADKEMPFVFAQDLISLIAAVLLLVMVFFEKKENIKLDIIRIGTVGYLFYVYGQYVMGTLYNYSYFLYLSIFSFSIFYLINVFAGIEYERIEFSIPKSLRIIIAVYCAVMTVFFAPQWIKELLNYIQTKSRPEADSLTFNYYVYILDLCFILPVCTLASIFLFQKKFLGYLLGGLLSFFGFALMLWVALGFICQHLFHQKTDVSSVIIYSSIALVFMVLSIFYFSYMKAIKTQVVQ